MKSQSMLGLVLLAVLICAGCASPWKPFPMVEVAPGIYEGPKPWAPAHFEALRAHGVRTILSLEQFPWDTLPERRLARRHGIQYRGVPILASPLQPREKSVNEALLALNELASRPVFVHCFLGKDRGTFMIGLYRVYFEGWTPQAAWEEMLHSGFHASLRLRGFETYFWQHTQRPDWATLPQDAKSSDRRTWTPATAAHSSSSSGPYTRFSR